MTQPGGRYPAACGVSPIYRPRTRDYDRAPFLAIWEVTQACDLACVHCRADARPWREPDELTREEARRLFVQIREMGTRLLVLTGGDPLKRPDIFDLIRDARERGLEPSLSPSATPLLDADALRRGRQAGLAAVSLSLDGGTARAHDSFRGVDGSYARTIDVARHVTENGLDLRVNTTVTSRNLGELDAIAEIVERIGARIWSVFFLVPMGRADQALQITPRQCEETLLWLYRLSARAPFRIKTTEAPHYRRIVLEELAREEGVGVQQILDRTRSGRGRFLPGMNDARGLVFISHRGDVYPSGFFPLAAGNVRETSLAVLYRDSVLFRDLRDPDLLKGRCGVCAYRWLCGGSRARAWAVSADPLGDDPLCDHDPMAVV